MKLALIVAAFLVLAGGSSAAFLFSLPESDLRQYSAEKACMDVLRSELNAPSSSVVSRIVTDITEIDYETALARTLNGVDDPTHRKARTIALKSSYDDGRPHKRMLVAVNYSPKGGAESWMGDIGACDYRVEGGSVKLSTIHYGGKEYGEEELLFRKPSSRWFSGIWRLAEVTVSDRASLAFEMLQRPE